MLGKMLDQDSEVLAAWLGVALTFLLGLLGVTRMLLKERDKRTESIRRLNVMWKAFTRRGEIEAEKFGMHELHDQDGNQVPGYVRARFASFADRLRAAYEKDWAALSATEAKFRIEEKFGNEIIERVCRPLEWDDGKCLQAAWLIAREPIGYEAPDSKQPRRPG